MTAGVPDSSMDGDIAQVRDVVSRSGTSFFWGMRVLPPPRRQAMYAIYAFCRIVDDIADEPAPLEEKLKGLETWRNEIELLYEGVPSHPVTRVLRPAVEAYDLPKSEFLAVIDGMEMDARGPIVAPPWSELMLYCRRVAGAVGTLAIHAFGAAGPDAETLAVTEGEALQLTNILRDVAEDAEDGRLYLPAELLRAHGIGSTVPSEVLAHPALPSVLRELSQTAHERYAAVHDLARRCDARALRPALVMLGIYERLLHHLDRRGWQHPTEPVKVPLPEKLWIVARQIVGIPG